MKVNIKRSPDAEYVRQGAGIMGMYDHIEKCGRVCYRSEPKGGESAEKFTKAMVSSGHLAMLEHGTVYLKIPVENALNDQPERIALGPYSRCHRVVERGFTAFDYVTTNYRVIIENNAERLLGYWCEPTHYHEKRVSILFDTNIGISREFNRHRVNSMAESSTRYCNYTKDKFGGAITVMEPAWLRDRDAIIGMTVKNKNLVDCTIEASTPEGYGQWEKLDWWLYAMETANFCYNNLIRLGCKPQEAREVLPLATSTQLVHTAFVDDWEHFFSLRAEDTPTNHPHPMAMELAVACQELLKTNGFL